MNGGWVVFAIFIGIAVISAISHVLKNQQQAEPEPARRRQQRPQRPVESEDDRFLAEIERLRKKAATAPAKAIPVVKPKPKKPRPSQSPPLRVDELPAATVVTPAAKPNSLAFPTASPAGYTVAKIAPIATIADVQRPAAAGAASAAKMLGTDRPDGGSSTAASTAYSRELLGILKSKSAMPLAVILHEVLGPPKSKR